MTTQQQARYKEVAACEMARKAVKRCSVQFVRFYGVSTCTGCGDLKDKTCGLRAYLASKGDAKAWEVTR